MRGQRHVTYYNSNLIFYFLFKIFVDGVPCGIDSVNIFLNNQIQFNREITQRGGGKKFRNIKKSVGLLRYKVSQKQIESSGGNNFVGEKEGTKEKIETKENIIVHKSVKCLSHDLGRLSFENNEEKTTKEKPSIRKKVKRLGQNLRKLSLNSSLNIKKSSLSVRKYANIRQAQLQEKQRKAIARNVENDLKKGNRLRHQRELKKFQINTESKDEKKKRLTSLKTSFKRNIRNESHATKKSRLNRIKLNLLQKKNQIHSVIFDENQKMIKTDKVRMKTDLEKKNEFSLEFLQYKKSFIESMQERKSPLDDLILNFFVDRTIGPTYDCFCCQGNFFRRQVVVKNVEQIVNKAEEYVYRQKKNENFDKKQFEKDIFHSQSGFLCKTCNDNISKGKVPRLAATENIKLRDVPECVTRLSPLEQILCSPYIGFMKLVELIPSSLNSQLGIKGGVVNIPVEINEMLKILPRKFDDMQVIQLALKRKLSHKTTYKCEIIRPAYLCDALKYLITTPLYKKHKIEIDPEYLDRYDKKYDIELDFIVDENDKACVKGFKEQQIFRNSVEDDSDSDSDNSDDEDHFSDDEVLLHVDSNLITIAPGENKIPMPSYSIENIDEFCHPSKFGGYPMQVENKLTYAEITKFQCRHIDSRHRETGRLLYMAKRRLEDDIRSAASIHLRKIQSNKRITANFVKNKENIKKLVQTDHAYIDYNFTKTCRSSPAFWAAKKSDQMAMVQQKGAPHLFLTISLSETKNPELLAILHENAKMGKISIEDAMKLSPEIKSKLVKNDPVTVVRYFEEMLLNLKHILQDPNGPFGGKYVVEYYIRREFQNRGSVHAHMLLWLKDPPKYEKDGSNKDLIEFIDEIITCKYDPKNPLVSFQRHKHTHTCYKKAKKVCRFHFPKYVMPCTKILEPLQRNKIKDKNEWKRLRDILKNINEKMNIFFKTNIRMGFEKILKELDITEDDYIKAIRTSIKSTTTFLRRSSLEVAINQYNFHILNMIQSNMDIQFILNPYACISYITDYINKGNTGLTKLLRNVSKQMQTENCSISDRLQKFANEFINGSLITAQESVYIILSMPLSECSISNIFINTKKINERSKMLKNKKSLKELSDDSEDIFESSVFDHYAQRDVAMENLCLADFATKCKDNVRRLKTIYKGSSFHRNFRDNKKILKYCRFKEEDENYYREQILLFMPWRNEIEQIEQVNHKEVYFANRTSIETKKREFNLITQAEMDAIEESLNKNNSEFDEMLDEISDDEEFRDYDLFQKKKNPEIKTNSSKAFKWTKPDPVSDETLNEMMLKLNSEQREIVMHVLHCFKTKTNLPLRIFLTGPAGTGKSRLIKVLYHLITNFFNKENPGEIDLDSEVVLLTASTGVAAHLINGNTLHSVFKIMPTEQKLSSSVTNTIRLKFKRTKLLLVDEASMIGARLFNQFNQRAQLLTGKNESFGGLNIIFFGDLIQLPPVLDKPIFAVPNTTALSKLIQVSPLWREFKIFELSEIMRQKNDLPFVNALNNLAQGQLTKQDIKLFETRVLKRSDVHKKVSQSCPRLFTTNNLVDEYNTERIKNVPGILHLSVAEDKIFSKNLSKEEIEQTLQSFKEKSVDSTQGLVTEIHLKINIKYMITRNINVADGLANGVVGILKHISFDQVDNTDVPNILWLDFQSNRIGNICRSDYYDFMKNENIDNHLVPITRKTITDYGKNQAYMITRKQFPIKAAEARTVHKSQGCTCDEVCIDFTESARLTTSMVYVAFSRVTSLSGLNIVEKLIIPPFQKSPAHIELERMRRDAKLSLSYTKEISGEPKLVYQNVNSLPNKLNFIKYDKWYKQASVLIFSETYTEKKHRDLGIPGFTIKSRYDSNLHHSGIICYFENEFYKSYKNIKVTCDIKFGGEKIAKYHSILLHFKIENTHIISGYKSPKTSIYVLKEQLENIFQEFAISSSDGVALFGDFNFNTKEHSPFEKYLNEHFDLKKALKDSDSTTTNYTQIDIVFTKKITHDSGVYETFFSDHKPIFVGIGGKTRSVCLKEMSDKNEIKSLRETKSLKRKTDTNSVNAQIPIKRGKKTHVNNKNVEVEEHESSNNMIIDLDEYENANDRVRSNEEIQQARLQIIRNEIRTYGTCLTDESMNYISELINSQSVNFNFQNTLILSEIRHEIKPVHTRSDIQFLFEKPIISCMKHRSNSACLFREHKCSCTGEVRNWRCFQFRNSEEKVFIYSSYNSNQLSNEDKRIIYKLYPSVNLLTDIVFRRLKYAQKEFTPCGIFSELRRKRIQDFNFNSNVEFVFEKSNISCRKYESEIKYYNLMCTCAEDVGHWICVHFKHPENKLFVYDSFNSNHLSSEHKDIISKLYPSINLLTDIVFKHLKYTQKTVTACGVFAAMCAITLVLGKDPSTINFKICYENEEDEAKYLRLHLLKIIDEFCITHFPEQEQE